MASRAKLATVQDELSAMDAERANRMRIWNAVCKTDPRHTKPVEFGRKFTAIDAHYQIQRATEVFGPVGEGWGYDTGEIVFEDGLVIVPVTLWHGNREQTFGPIYGSTTLRDRKGNIDKDAPKKATTDALTKALSQLGFNADVFLGRFDDNKYVAEVAKEFAANDANANPTTGEPKPTKERVKLDGPYTSKTALWGAVKAFVHAANGMSDLGEWIGYRDSKEVVEMLEQCKRDAPALWSEGLPDLPEYEPLEIFIARKNREMEQLESMRG